MPNLYHGLWVDYEELILAVALAEDHLLVRVIRTERTPQGKRPVFFRAEHDMNDWEGAKTMACQEAEIVLKHEIPATDLKWREYADLGLLIRLL